MKMQTMKRFLLILAFAGSNTGFASGVNTYTDDLNKESHLPPQQRRGSISFISGGIGRDESQALRREASRWPLTLQFTTTAGRYVADVQVRITHSKGKGILKTKSLGPYMLVRLRPGRYTVYARYFDSTQKRFVNVKSDHPTKISFYWKEQ